MYKMCGYIAFAPIAWSSAAIETVWENGKMFTNVENPFERVDIGIKTPPKIPANEIKIEEIGPVCFSFLQIIPIKMPRQI